MRHCLSMTNVFQNRNTPAYYSLITYFYGCLTCFAARRARFCPASFALAFC